MIVRAAFARLDPVALAAATGTLVALALWAMTAALLLKGPSAEALAAGHAAVGPHLALLGNFLPGYTVTWGGSVVGLVYGLLLGAIAGGLVATFWNTVHHIVLVTVLVRRNFSSEL